MPSDEAADARAARARDRRTWVVRLTNLDDEGRVALCASTTAEERIAMMRALAAEAWRLAGAEWPVYERSAAPIHRSTLSEA